MSSGTDIARLVSYKKAFTVTTDLLVIPTIAETPLLLLKNPTDSAINLMITHFLVGTDSSSVRSVFRKYCNPTITTDGVPLSIANTYIGPTPPQSLMGCFKTPVIADNGMILNMSIIPENAPSRGINRVYWLAPDHELLITVENSVSNASSFADISWIEGP